MDLRRFCLWDVLERSNLRPKLLKVTLMLMKSEPDFIDDVSEGIAQLFQDEGIEVLSGTTVTGVEGRSGKFVTRRVPARAMSSARTF